MVHINSGQVKADYLIQTCELKPSDQSKPVIIYATKKDGIDITDLLYVSIKLNDDG